MKCETAQQVFSDYAEETIERPLAVTLEHHFDECAECRQAYQDFSSTWRILEQFPEAEPPSNFRTMVMSRIQAEQESTQRSTVTWRSKWANVLGVRVPARAFAWTMSVLIVAALLVRVTPGVFQATLTGPLGGSCVMTPSPGMDVSVRTADVATGVDRYEVALRPTPGAGPVSAVLSSQENGNRTAHVANGREVIFPFEMKQPQGIAEPLAVLVRWKYSGQSHSKVVYLPRSKDVSEPPFTRISSSDIHTALRRISAAYGVAITADAGLKGSVTLSGRYDSAKAALDPVADKFGLEVRKEGSRAFKLEPK